VILLSDNDDMKDAVNAFVISLEEEPKKGKKVETEKIEKENIEENENKELKKFTGLDKIVTILKKILGFICTDEDIGIEIDTENLIISIYGKDLDIAIGKNGSNIEALEYIINLIGKRKKLIDRRIIIDIKDYRKKNIETLEKIALQMASKAVKEGRIIALRPMQSYERKVIHNLLENFKDVKTRSRDKEPNRRIVIYPANSNR
jgi:spoIIIJ-associated protein